MSRPSLAVGLAVRSARANALQLIDALAELARGRGALAALQDVEAERRAIEVLVLDCSASEEIDQRLARAPWLRSIALHPAEYDDGDTRNFLVAETQAETLLMLDETAALPGAPWLAALGAALSHAATAAWLAPARLESPSSAEFSSSLGPSGLDWREIEPAAFVVRRSVWERHPFGRVALGACVLFERACARAGLDVERLAPLDCAREWNLAEERARALALGWLARAHGLGRAPQSRAEALRWAKELPLESEASPRNLARRPSLERRSMAAHALLEGARNVESVAPSQLLAPGRKLSILYVVHGFPPDSWAGTEVYTLELARAMARLGHRVSVLARAPCALPLEQGGRPDFSMSCDDFQGLRVWRMVHRIEHRNLRESYRQPLAEDRFREVLQQEQPDLVHFQHLLHFSAGLPQMTKQRGIPSLVTCNDYWGLCARVQMIRPDGVVCQENQGLGCLVCVKQKAPGHIPFARQAFPLVGPLIPMARLLAEHPRIPSAKVRRRLARLNHARQIVLSRWGRDYEHMRERQPYVLAGYAAADLLIAPSRFLRAKYLASGAFDPRRCVYSDYGMRTADVHRVDKAPDPAGRLRLGFIGSVVWYKGLDVLVRAVRQLDGRPLVLKVHGRFDPGADPHHAEIARLAQGGAVEFHGGFDNARLAEVLAGVDLLVVPSVWFENSPLTIHEAFLHRTPVLTSNIGGMAELVEDGVDGLHFAVGDHQDLARVIQGLLDRPERVAALSKRFGRVKSIEEHGREMEYRYKALVCARPAQRRDVLGA